MPDQSTPQVPSIYDGLRVRVAQGLEAADAAMGSPVANTVKAGENLVGQVKDIATDPTKRRDFVHGTLLGMASGSDDALEGVPEIYEGLRVRKADTPDPAKLAKDAGLVYKDEAVKGSGVHQFEHPDHPGATMAVKEADLSTSEALKARMTAKLAEKPIVPKVTNASGESSASQEAINRTAAEKLGKISRVKIDTRSGKETPLVGVDSADAKVQPHEVIVQRSPKGETLLDKGAKARYKGL